MAMPSSPLGCQADRQGMREACSQVLRVVSGVGPHPPCCLQVGAATIHDVFHVVFLKKFPGTLPVVVPCLPPIKHGRVLPQPEKVLHAHLNRGASEILVQSMAQAAVDTTWEKVTEFKDAYPSFQLDVDAFIRRKYQRRPSWPNQRCPQPCRRSPHPCRAWR
jgi:hypothetical protein